MKGPTCYIVDKKIDNYLASKFGWKEDVPGKGMNPHRIASLRGMYDGYAELVGEEPLLPESPSEEDLDRAFEKLKNYRTGIRSLTRERMAKGTKHIERCWDNLRHAFSLNQRASRITLLSNLFSAEVDRLMQGGKADRQSLINGFTTVKGEHIGGELSIMDGVYNQVLEIRQTWYEDALDPETAFSDKKEATERAHKEGRRGPLDFIGAPTNVEEYKDYAQKVYDEYTKILTNWNELIPFVLKDLVKKEGVKLGIRKEYADVASSDSFGENDIAAKWDLSESVRDGWQRNNDLESSFGSVGQQVRRILATVPEMEAIPEFDADGNYIGMKYLPKVDDIGNPVFMDATKTHQALQEFLRGMDDSEDLLIVMCKEGKPGEAKIAWMQPIVDILASSPQARTQFFVDFKRNFQPYSVMWEDKKKSFGPIKAIKTRILNKPINILKGKYAMLLSPRGKFPVNVEAWRVKPIFDEATKKVDWKRLAEVRDEVLQWCHEDIINEEGLENLQDGDIRTQARYASNSTEGVTVAPLVNNGNNAFITINGGERKLTFDMKREFLMRTFSALGFDVNVDTIDSILSSGDVYEVRRQLLQLFDPEGNTGILYAAGIKKLDVNDLETIQIEKLKREGKTFRWLYRKEMITQDGRKIRPVSEHIGKLLDVISDHQEGYRIESRARYMDNTMYSFVNPSYLGDRLETIEKFVNKNDKEGLFNFLKEEYLQSPFFVDDEFLATGGQSGRILNRWLSELIDACCNKKTDLKDSVAAIFTYERDLGREDKEFEDFTAKEHGIDMMIHFFADEQQKKGYGGRGSRDLRKKLSAMYPIFTLGDAGVSKYIRAPRIASAVWVDKDGNLSRNDKTRHHIDYRFDTNADGTGAQDQIIDSFWDVYLQEKRRMELEKLTALEMYANGKKVNHAEGEFSFLTFLNPNSQEYQDKYAIPEGMEADESTIKNIIREYLNDATKIFQKRLEDLGALETADVKDKKLYRYLNSIATPENIDEKIKEFFWNTKLATIQQLQLMTIDPSFYHGTKDLQKRYKEIHAPGTKLDVKARNPFSEQHELFSSDGIERMAYFDDLKVNSEEWNPEFMEVILRNFAEASEEEVEAAIKDGIVRPKVDPLEETARKNKLSDLLGDNYGIYDTYTGNTLTDGQGFRTLVGYRRVMGMAGKWTQEMENAYNAIMDIRKKHEIRDASNRIVDYTELTPEELKMIGKYALTLQPIKPYMFTHEKVPVRVAKRDSKGNIVYGRDGKPLMIDTFQYIPVQHKYAEALIIPELMPKGHKLRDLGLWMDNNNVDMVGSTKIGKVGVFGQANLSGVKSKEDLHAAMSAAKIHELPYRDYRIQTNVPEHINASQLFGTQVRKLIMAGLDLEGGAQFYADLLGIETLNLSTEEDGRGNNAKATLDGRNLLALYNSLICANIFDSYEKFSQNADNIRLLSELLQQSTLGSTREAMDNLFSYVVTGDDKFLIPLFEGGLEHDSAALILSTFKKIVNKQQISGGSAVQVSAFGIQGYEEDGGLRFVQDPDNPKNILYAEIEMPFDKSFMLDVKNADGSITKTPVKLDYDTYCNPDGTLIPIGNPLEKGSKEYKKYLSYTYKEVDGKLVACKHNDSEAKVYKPKIEAEYPGILSILAYRIPTERDYSMLNCQIKRFTSKLAGGTMKVPPEGTSIAGFDFDIDKLYFMQREYHKHYNSNAYTEQYYNDNQKIDIWNAFYEKNKEIEDALRNARANAEAKDSSLVTEIQLKSGRIIRKSNTKLNAYWNDAKIEERFGKSKKDAFAETAQALGVQPNVKEINGEPVEWMEEYDFSLPPEDPRNTRAARNNLLISIIQARLMDPQTVKQRYTPGGFDNAKKAARLMRELFFGDLDGVVNGSTVNLSALEKRQGEDADPEPNYDPSDPYTLLVYNQQNQVAAKLIGIFANQNTNHAFASAMDEFYLNQPIEFCGHSFSDLLHKGPDAAQIDLNMAEFLAASVDAVKDPVLNFLNLNTVTADAGAVLARLGYTTKEIGLLFNQPVIRKVCEDTLNGKNVNTAIDDERKELLGYMTGMRTSREPITEQSLAKAIIQERLVKENGHTTQDFLSDNAKDQMAVLELFEQILKASKDVSDFVLSTKFTASNAVKSTFGGMYAQQLKVASYVARFPDSQTKGDLSYTMVVAKNLKGSGLFDRPIDNNPNYLTMSKKEYLRHIRFNPFAFEQAMFDMNRRAIKTLAKYYPYETEMYKRIRDKMQDLAVFGILSEDDINDIHSNIPVALLSKQTRSLFNGEAAHGNTGSTHREYYREKFAEDLQEMLAEDPELAKLEIFKYITPNSDTVNELDDTTGQPKKDAEGFPIQKEVWKIQMQDIGGMDADIKEAIRESWAYLMEVKDDGYFTSETYATLGRDLFMYCFYQLGFDFSPISFMHLAPTAVKDSIIVEREFGLPVNDYDGNIEAGTQDVYVWSPAVTGGAQRARDEFGGNLSYVGELTGNSMQLSEKMGYNDAVALINEAQSHPELKFKVAIEMSQEDFDQFAFESVGRHVSANIYFTSSSLAGKDTSKMSYGKGRSYRQFLNDVLEGKEASLNPDEFAQMWILNHLDNARFVLDTDKSGDFIRKMIKEQTSLAGNTIKDGMQYRPYITIDISKYNSDEDMKSLSRLVSVNQFGVHTWCPCIKIGDSYYMAQSGTDSFNVNQSDKITYRKVVPWGSAKTIEYDGNQELRPQMKYKVSLDTTPERSKAPVTIPSNDTNTAPEPQIDPINSNVNQMRMNREDMINYCFDEMVKAATAAYGGIEYEGRKAIRRDLSLLSDQGLEAYVETIRKACRENGVMMLDENGNPKVGC